MKNKEIKCVVGLFGLALVMPLIGGAQAFSSRPNIFGGQNFFSHGRMIGSSRANIFGGQDFFRGINESVLFASDEFSKQFPEDAWVDAAGRRDVQEMISCAWELKRVETVLSRKDTKTTSSALFEAAAQVAVGQKNVEALTQIVALAPECAKYMDELKASGTTRGGASVKAFPEVVYADYPFFSPDEKGREAWDDAIKGLEPYQTPHLRFDMVCLNFRGMSAPEAENVAMLLNRGRITNDAKLLVQAAISLKGQPGQAHDAFLNPVAIMDEAAELAIAMEDRTALNMVLDVISSNAYGLQSGERAVIYTEELKLLGQSRGMSSLGGGAVTMELLLRPPYQLDFVTPETFGNGRHMKF